MCLKHSKQMCEQYCEYCSVPSCAMCFFSGEHEQHEKESIFQNPFRGSWNSCTDLQELEESIYPNYQEVVTLNNKAQTLHSEIDTIIQHIQSDIDDMDSKFVATMNKQQTVINHTIKEISHVILEVRRLLETNDVHLVSKYQS